MTKPVVLVDKKTGAVLERYKSVEEAGGRVVQNECYERRLGVLKSCYRYESDDWFEEDWEGRRNVPVWVMDIESKAVFWASTQGVAAKALRVSKTSVSNAVNRGWIIADRYKIKRQTRFGEEPPSFEEDETSA